MEQITILKGDIIYNMTAQEFVTIKDGYLIFSEKEILGAFETIPEEWKHGKVVDYSGKLILPGLVDLHTHAPQYPFRGVGMDMELLPWLNQYAFPEESKYQDIAYATEVYQTYAEDIQKSATTRLCIFGTLHREATEILMDQLEKIGVCSYVGKVNMDTNCPDYLTEDCETSVAETEKWLTEIAGKYQYTKPILTPRFVPSCSVELMDKLGQLSVQYGLPVQSHLSENLSEIQLVAQMHPDSESYGAVYDKYHLFGKDTNCVMAHCVHSDCNENEWELMKHRNVWVAHCPDSNMNLSSGIAPAGRYIREGYKIGLGSDVAGGTKLSIFAAMADAIKVSKLRWVYVSPEVSPLTTAEAFYMATKGGGAFFGKVGSFEKGYEADILVIDDHKLKAESFSIKERLEKAIYLSEDCVLDAKYVQGRLVYHQ